MDIERLRKLAGMNTETVVAPSQINEKEMSLEDQLKSYEDQLKTEYDPRGKSALQFKIKKLKEQLAAK